MLMRMENPSAALFTFQYRVRKNKSNLNKYKLSDPPPFLSCYIYKKRKERQTDRIELANFCRAVTVAAAAAAAVDRQPVGADRARR